MTVRNAHIAARGLAGALAFTGALSFTGSLALATAGDTAATPAPAPAAAATPTQATDAAAPSAEATAASTTATADDPAPGGRMEPLPADLEGVGVIDRPAAHLPLWLTFTDDRGQKVSLGTYFKERPVLLTMNYSNCPMLCSLQLDGLVEGLKGLGWTAGDEFQIVTVSIDPTERTELARKTKQKYLTTYGRADAENGWHFLTGEKADIQELADSLGFQFRYVEDRREYAHAAVTFVATPDGRLSRDLYGVLYDPQTIRLSLVEASRGKIGSPLDKILLFCFHYDAAKGRYGPVAMRLMQLGGGFTALVLGMTLASFWRRDHGRRRASLSPASGDERS